MNGRSSTYVREHDNEPLVGLPERLPAGERLLWQRSPSTAAVARHVMHINKVIAWFGFICAWRVVYHWRSTGLWSADVLALPVLAMCVGVGLLVLLAWLYARTTVYTLTTRRVALRFGIAVQITMNVPFGKIRKADVCDFGGDRGNIALSLVDDARISYFVLWPHVRPWRWMSPQPMLLCVDGLSDAADILTGAVVEHSSQNTNTEIDQKAPAAPAMESV